VSVWDLATGAGTNPKRHRDWDLGFGIAGVPIINRSSNSESVFGQKCVKTE
jgi:hypothetical protein